MASLQQARTDVIQKGLGRRYAEISSQKDSPRNYMFHQEAIICNIKHLQSRIAYEVDVLTYYRKARVKAGPLTSSKWAAGDTDLPKSLNIESSISPKLRGQSSHFGPSVLHSHLHDVTTLTNLFASFLKLESSAQLGSLRWNKALSRASRVPTTSNIALYSS